MKRTLTTLLLAAAAALALMVTTALPAQAAAWKGQVQGSQANPQGKTLSYYLYYSGVDPGSTRHVYSTLRYNTGLAAWLCVWDKSSGGAGVCDKTAPGGWYNDTLASGVSSLDAYVYTSVCGPAVNQCTARKQVWLPR